MFRVEPSTDMLNPDVILQEFPTDNNQTNKHVKAADDGKA